MGSQPGNCGGGGPGKWSRLAVFLCVLLFHGALGVLLIRASRIRLAVDQITPSFAIELLPELSRVPLNGNRPDGEFEADKQSRNQTALGGGRGASNQFR